MKKLLLTLACVVSFFLTSVAQAENTSNNLKTSITSESVASVRYSLYSATAAKENYPALAKLFAAVSNAKIIRANNHTTALSENFEPRINPVSATDTLSNLQTALGNENYGVSTMYPAFVAQAEKDGNSNAVKRFKTAEVVGHSHALLYAAAFNKRLSLKGVDADWHLCGSCGYISEGIPPESCPVCKANSVSFIKNPPAAP